SDRVLAHEIAELLRPVAAGQDRVFLSTWHRGFVGLRGGIALRHGVGRGVYCKLTIDNFQLRICKSILDVDANWKLSIVNCQFAIPWERNGPRRGDWERLIHCTRVRCLWLHLPA